MSKRTTAATVLIAALSMASLAGCTDTTFATRPEPEVSESAASETSTAPAVADAPNGGLPENCEQWSAIRFGYYDEGNPTTNVWLEGPDLIDTGEREFARGPVEVNDAGEIVSYTVEAGDSPAAIGQRFCVDYVTVQQFNHRWPTVHPGDVLLLLVDESVPFTRETP